MSYVRVLRMIADQRHPDGRWPVALHAQHLNHGAGDPEEMLKRTIRHLQQDAHKNRKSDGYSGRFVLLDADRMTGDIGKAAFRLAARHSIHLILQDPLHEAFLLRHLPAHQNARPAKDKAEAMLKRAWPEYQKGLPAQKLANRIDHAAVRRAQEVEPALHAFLEAVRFPG